MDTWREILNLEFAGNAVWRIGGFFLVLLVFLVGGRLAQFQLLRVSQLRRKQGHLFWPALLAAFARASSLLMLAIGLFQAFRLLAVTEKLQGMDPARPARVVFNEFNAASLNLMAIYWFHPPDFIAALAFAEKFNLALLERFNAEAIEFAFPTQTLFLAGDPKRALTVPSAVSDDVPSAGGA